MIVGRNEDIILKSCHLFNIFVYADIQSKLKRCRDRAQEDENLTEKELIRKMRQIDKSRAQTREIISGTAWRQRDVYHLCVNTSDWIIKYLALAVADYAMRWFGRSI